jgi:hypothetical protein
MRFASIVIITLATAACGGSPPTAPTPPATQPASPVPAPPAPTPPAPTREGTGSLVVMVLQASGACILGATVQILENANAVQSATQTEECSYWDYGPLLSFKNLPIGEMTVRASAAGYVTSEVTATPSISREPVIITLERQ